MSGTVLVVGFTDDQTRVSALLNLALLLSMNGETVATMSVSTTTFGHDLTLFDSDLEQVREFRSRRGLLDLYDEYVAALQAPVPTTPVGDRILTYGSLSLTAPSSLLTTVQLGEPSIRVLRGAPRAFSRTRPLTGHEPPIRWEEFWRQEAGDAFLRHVLDDLRSEASTVLIDCDGVADAEAAARVAQLVDLVVLLPSADIEESRSAAYHYALAVRDARTGRRPEILPIPVAVHDGIPPDARETVRTNFQENFRSCTPADLHPYWFVEAEIPYVQHYVTTRELVVRESLQRVHVHLWRACSSLQTLVTERLIALAATPADPAEDLAQAFMTARSRAGWDVFISYSSIDSDFGRRMREYLRTHRLRAFLAVDDMPIAVGTDQWRVAIDRVLDRSRLLILLVTEASLNSAEVTYELERFATTGRQVLPVIIDAAADATALRARHHAVRWEPQSQELDEVRDLMPLVHGGLADL